MITKLFNKYHWLRLLVIPYVLFFVCVFSYNNYSKTMPVSFWDEILWVGRSYFFEFFIHGDYDNRIWQSGEAYDQPKLAEYAYGAWLYPFYLMDKSKNPKPFDYTRFLIKNGFYEIDESYMDTYVDYKNNSTVIRFDDRMSGFPEEWITKYGQESLKPISLIYKAKILNLFVLAGAVVLAYFVALQYQGVIFAIIFSILYGFNSLIINTSLVAHSEALFLFTFNAALLFIILYFTKGRKIFYLLLFSIFAGLSMSTKLNGVILVAIFFVVNSILPVFLKKERIKHFLVGLFPILICLVVFVILNPFTYPDPVKNVQKMFDSRMETAINQSKFSSEYYIPPGITRIGKIFTNFYFSEQTPYFSGVKIFEPFAQEKNYGIYLFALFSLGLFYLLRQVFKKNVIAIIILISFILILLSMVYYLILDWPRYYAHLILFFSIFQSLGLFLIIQFVYKHTKLLAERAINRAR